MSFDDAFTRLLGHEGDYSNNPSDPGGATRYGVTQAVARFNGYQGDMKDFPIEQAKAIYKKQYWDSIGIVNLPPEVQFTVFDGAVNSGPVQSAKWLQRAVGTDPDGVIGHATIAACKLLPPSVVVARYNGHRLQFMTGLKTWTVFGNGWARRIASNLIAT